MYTLLNFFFTYLSVISTVFAQKLMGLVKLKFLLFPHFPMFWCLSVGFLGLWNKGREPSIVARECTGELFTARVW
jgi:hypothetical protein